MLFVHLLYAMKLIILSRQARDKQRRENSTKRTLNKKNTTTVPFLFAETMKNTPSSLRATSRASRQAARCIRSTTAPGSGVKRNASLLISSFPCENDVSKHKTGPGSGQMQGKLNQKLCVLFRAFDYSRWEVFGSNADWGWPAFGIVSAHR